MVPIKFICGYPLNAITDRRNGNGGCTPLCHETGIGINSTKLWVEHFDSFNRSISKQCAFCLKDEARAYERFKIIVESIEYIQREDEEFSMKNNEFVVEAINDPKKLPVKAIFYTSGTLYDIAMRRAKELQTDFQKAVGRDVPLVSVQFPRSNPRNLDVKIENYVPKPPKNHSSCKEFI